MYTKTYKINENWSEYDKSVAECQLENYSVIYLDDYGCPIDDIYITDDIFENVDIGINMQCIDDPEETEAMEMAIKLNDLYQDLDPYDFDPDSFPPEEIAGLIENKEKWLLDDLKGLIKDCTEREHDEMTIKMQQLLSDLEKLYKQG